jgi:hypothetical protein
VSTRPTDPVTAAVLLRRVLEDIASGKESAPRQAAGAALDRIRLEPPGPGEIRVSSGYGRKTRAPFVTLALPPDVSTVQLPPDQARQIAMQLLEAAEASHSDAFLAGYLRTKVGLEDIEKIAMVIEDARAFRDACRAEPGEAAPE